MYPVLRTLLRFAILSVLFFVLLSITNVIFSFCFLPVGEFETDPPGTEGAVATGYVPVAENTAEITGGTVLAGKVSLHDRVSDSILTNDGPEFGGNNKGLKPQTSAPDRSNPAPDGGNPESTVDTVSENITDNIDVMSQLSLESDRNDGLENININVDDIVSRKPINKRRKHKISNNHNRNNKDPVPTKVNDIDNISRINAILSHRNSNRTNNDNRSEGEAAQKGVKEDSSLLSTTNTNNSSSNNNSSPQKHFREGRGEHQ